MNNVDTFSQTIHQMEFEYLLRLEAQLEQILTEKHKFPDASIRELKTKIRLLKGRLMKGKRIF